MGVKKIRPGQYRVTGNSRRLADALVTLVTESERTSSFDRAGAEGFRRGVIAGEIDTQTRILSLDGRAYPQVEIDERGGRMWEHPRNDESVKATAVRWDELAQPKKKKE